MNFDPLSFAIGNHGDSGPVRDVVSYLMGRAVSAAGEIWQTNTNVVVASFTAVSSTLRDLVIDVTPVQSGSGTPSPTNVRPISGWTGANIGVAGTNLFDKSSTLTTGNIKNDGTIGTSSYGRISDYIKINPSTAYYVTYALASDKWLAWYDKDKNFISRAGYGASGTSITSPATAMYVRCTVSFTDNDATRTYEINSFMLSPFDSAYKPYTGTTYPVSWQPEAGTVYGGTLRGNGDGTWTLKARPYYASYNGETLVGPWVSSMDVYAEGATPTTGAQVVDLGGAETEYILTAESVLALLGQNNIFADTGNINTITFRTH